MKKIILGALSIWMILLGVNCTKKEPAETGKKEPGRQESTAEKKVKKNEGTPKNKKVDDKQTDAIPVQVTTPVVGDISSSLLFSSNIDSDKMVDIYPLTSGIIQKIYYDEGDRVEKDTVLAVLDDREAVLNAKKAEINYQQLKIEFARQEEIYKQNLISKEDYEKLKYNLDDRLLDWKKQQLLLSYTRITSPIAGIVSKRYIKAGNKITTAQLAFSVVNTHEKIAIVNIPGQEKNHIFLNQKSNILAGTSVIPGHIMRISPSIDPQSGTFKVTVAVKDQKNQLSVGQFVNVKIIKKVHKDVILLTKEALVYDGGKIFVYIVDEENRAVKKLIKTGFEEGSQIEVTEGVKRLDKVVTAGKSSLKNKTLIRIVDPIIS